MFLRRFYLHFQSWPLVLGHRGLCLSGNWGTSEASGLNGLPHMLWTLSRESGYFLAIRSAEILREDIEQKCEAVSASLRHFLNHYHVFYDTQGRNVFKVMRPRCTSYGKASVRLKISLKPCQCHCLLLFLIICLLWGKKTGLKSNMITNIPVFVAQSS